MTHETTLKTIGGIALIVAVFALAAALMTGGAAAAEVANESVTLEDGDDLEIAIEWTDTADAANSSTIELYDSGVRTDAGTLDAANFSGTLNGTVFELTDSARENAVYQVELDTTASTITVNGSAFAADGTVDLSTVTETSITADDTVLSVTLEAATVDTFSVASDPGNTTTTTWVVPDDLDAGEYDVLVDATESDVFATHVDVFSDDGGTIIDDITGDADPLISFGVLALLLGGGYYARKEGWL